MKIASSEISMQSEHSSVSTYSRSESLLAWNGNSGGKGNDSGAPSASMPILASTISISDQARSANATDKAAAANTKDGIDSQYSLLIALIEAITGKKVKVFNGQALNANASAGPALTAPSAATGASGMRYQFHEQYQEVEQTSVAASGVIKTADGKTINFQMNLSMSRSYSQTTDVSVSSGSQPAQTKDPLVINFGGTAAQLSDQRFSFDLDGDGTPEQIAQFASNSGYLALDKNGDGKINNGTELFGPQTNNGYAELSKYDSDGNGWIDENDPIFSQLKIWRPDANGGSLMSLKDAGIGALALAHTSSAFGLRGQNNSNLGSIRDTGIYLKEDGTVGTMQEVDLTV